MMLALFICQKILLNEMQPKIVVLIHYGSVVGTK